MSRQARDPISGSWMPIAGYPEIDAALDIESINPIQNQAVANPIEAIVNVYGSKNLLPNNTVTQTINGITFTVNPDGSITANGTATANTNLDLLPNGTLDMSVCGGKIISGCNSGSLSTYYLYVQQVGSPYTVYAQCTDQPLLLPVVSGNANCRFYVISGTTLNNVTIYPMIRDARITDPTYVPYAMTNRELTKKVNSILNRTPYSSTRAWHGSTLTFSNIVNNNTIYKLYAGSQAAKIVELTIVKLSSNIAYQNLTTNIATPSLSGSTLTITLPADEYWVYSFEELVSYH